MFRNMEMFRYAESIFLLSVLLKIKNRQLLTIKMLSFIFHLKTGNKANFFGKIEQTARGGGDFLRGKSKGAEKPRPYFIQIYLFGFSDGSFFSFFFAAEQHAQEEQSQPQQPPFPFFFFQRPAMITPATTAIAPIRIMISTAFIFYTFCNFNFAFLLYSTTPAISAAAAAAKKKQVHHQLPIT